MKTGNAYGISIMLFQGDLHLSRIGSIIIGCPFGHIVIIR